jgi:hypothetical protein
LHPYAALGAAAVLAIAVCALQVVKGFGWTWNTGGYEYPVFWAIVCIAVALEKWKAVFAARKPASISAAARLSSAEPIVAGFRENASLTMVTKRADHCPTVGRLTFAYR